MPVEITPEYLARSGTEDGHQSALFMFATDPRYAGERGENDALWKLLYSIPNGGARSGATAARMKATGAKKGFPDIGVPVARCGCHALYIELKRPQSSGKRKGVTADDQTNWHDELIAQGNGVIVCYGWLTARMLINHYFTNIVPYNSFAGYSYA